MADLQGRRFIDPSTLVSHFHIREGDAIADLGAGSGFYVEALAKLVGSSGRLYVCEVQKELVEKLGVLIRTKGLFAVDPIWCDIEMVGGTKITDGSLDVAVMINTLFQLEDKVSAVEEVRRILRSGGKFFVVDWTDSFSGMGPHKDQVFTAENAKVLLESHGFAYERSFDAGDHHYGTAFRKL